MGRAISMSEAIAIEVEVDVEGDRHRRQALVTAVGKYLAAHDPDKASHPALLEREDCTLVAWYRCFTHLAREGVMTVTIGRRELLAALSGAAAAWPFATRAQQERMRRIGVLAGGAVATDAYTQERNATLAKSLQQLGWVVGRSVQIDFRYGLGNAANTRKYAEELVALSPDVVLASGSSALTPLLQVTRTVPIVFVAVADPVGAGFVESMARLIETEEPAEFLGRRARRAKAVGRMVAIAIADRQRAEQHLLRRHSDEWTDDAMHARPGFLGAGIEAVAARQIHQGVDVTAEIGPLARPKPAIDGDEQRDRRVEERVIAFVLSKPRRDIVASDLKRAVKLRAKMLAARFVRLPHCLGIDRIFRFEYWLLTRVAAGDRHRDLPLELGERRSGERINLPRLQIAAGSRARRMCDQVAHQFKIDRLVEEPTARDPGIDGCKDVHGVTLHGGSPGA